MIPSLFGAILLTFAVIQFVPGGPVEQYLAQAKAAAPGLADMASNTDAEGQSGYRGGEGVDAKQLAQIKALHGFVKPVHIRFGDMLKEFARFDLGTSFYQNKSVWELIQEKLPVSISLGLSTFFYQLPGCGSTGRTKSRACRFAL